MRVHEPLRLMLQMAVSGMAPTRLEESLQASCAGVPLGVTEVQLPGEGRVHLADPQPGMVTVTYDATIRSTAHSAAVTEADCISHLRPSRYSESDRLAPIAQAGFAGITGGADLLAGVSSWVGSQLRYVPGSSGPTDGAVDTLLKREGVCRDYAHLLIALLRALGVPARLAAVYAPGLDPMDFHAVAEAAVDGQCRAVDATLLAPRQSLVRIATGRAAAATSFLSAYGGAADLLRTDASAVVDGQLPGDEITALVSIA